MKELLRRLVKTPGVSGEESQIRELIKNEVEEHAETVETDDFGNLIARKGEGDFTLLLDAHMDQIGLSVRRVTEEGYLKVSKVGGMFPANSVSRKMVVHASEGDEIKGVLGQKPPHLRDRDEKTEVPELEDVFVDVGADTEEDVEELGIRVGDRLTYDTELEELQKDYVTGPAFDNRVGCAVAIQALKSFDEDYELAVVFATQEEVGTKGARTAAYRVDPDVALAVDVALAGDHPGVEPDKSSESLGDGVGIDMIQAGGRGLITPEKVKDWLIETAEKTDNNYFRSLYDGGATDARSIELVKDGIPTGSLGVPLRYMHSDIEVVKLSDMEDAVRLLENCFGSVRNHF